ncbi:MAG: cobalt ECF transporter T component CbiQ [Candidatus Omnitrophota bacterium]
MSGGHCGNFIERSMSAAVSFLKESVFSDEYASKRGLLQSLDPRMKFATFAIFLLSILFSRSITALFYFYAISLGLARLSNIGMGYFLKRTWIFIPLFSLFIAVPALFSAFTPGDTLASFEALGFRLAVTRQGLSVATLFVMRVVTSVSFVILLSMTTRHFELLKALRVFGAPQVFVMILGMCYRYIYLFAQLIENTFLAIKSRAGTDVRAGAGRRVIAWNIASLWYRSYRLNEEVYNAMLSRGYWGEPVIFDDFRMKPADWLWLCVVTATCAAPVMLGANIRF